MRAPTLRSSQIQSALYFLALALKNLALQQNSGEFALSALLFLYFHARSSPFCSSSLGADPTRRRLQIQLKTWLRMSQEVTHRDACGSRDPDCSLPNRLQAYRKRKSLARP